MARIRFIIVEAAAAGIFLLPLLFLLKKCCFHDRKRTSAYGIFALYLCVIWALVGLPNAYYIRFDVNLNLIPFAGILDDLKNSVLNVLLFVPFGFLLPVLWTRFRGFKSTVLFGLCVSAAIELLQIFTFRATDINDLITNTFGTLLGWIFGSLAAGKLPAFFPKRSVKDLWILIACVFAVMVFAHPLLSNYLWSLIY